jgi:Na+/glutamate symporter
VPTKAFDDVDSRREGEAALVGGLFYVGAVAAVGLVVASGGTAAAALIAAALAGGGGGLIGAALAQFLEHRHAHRLQEQLDHGGLLLWVRTPTAADEERATEILRGNGADDVHVHDLPEQHYAMTGGESYEMSFMKRLGM